MQMANHTEPPVENEENEYIPENGIRYMSFTMLLGPIALALVLHPLGNAVPWLKTVPTTLTFLMTTIICSFFWFRHVVSSMFFFLTFFLFDGLPDFLSCAASYFRYPETRGYS